MSTLGKYIKNYFNIGKYIKNYVKIEEILHKL